MYCCIYQLSNEYDICNCCFGNCFNFCVCVCVYVAFGYFPWVQAKLFYCVPDEIFWLADFQSLVLFWFPSKNFLIGPFGVINSAFWLVVVCSFLWKIFWLVHRWLTHPPVDLYTYPVEITVHRLPAHRYSPIYTGGPAGTTNIPCWPTGVNRWVPVGQ